MRLGISLVPLLGWLWLASALAAPVPVGVVSFREVAVYPALSVPGTVLSLNRSELAAETRGRILQVRVRVGDRVRRNEPLVVLDCRTQHNARKAAQAALTQAKARLDLARRELRRARSLLEEQNISRELLEQRENAVVQAEAAVQAAAAQAADAELEVERCTVRAPFDGIVLERLAGVGELAVPGTPLLRLLDRGSLEVAAEVPASLAGPAADDEIWLEIDGRKYPLRLRTWVDAIDTRSRTREARLVFTGEAALPGSAGRVLWRARTPHVPASLLVRRGGRLGVFLAEGGHARFRPLPAAEEGHPAPAPGLPLDALLIREGRHGLEDGQAIEPR
ncbi:MAG TPA: efflux RND transporter periplasmic adaptor subunit [Thiotrichales bacterium]|nr:efflux RND transporter periplasmic adaptor subunit [Thiotrichales bacterium]